MISDAEKNLTRGNTYTLKDIEPFSSWVRVTLEEFPEMELTLSFFEWEKPTSPVAN
jgi:hypothetical protein